MATAEQAKTPPDGTRQGLYRAVEQDRSDSPDNSRNDLSRQGKAAVAYAARGIALHPLKPKAKTPLLAAWQEKATSDVSTVRQWWERWPRANIGAATGEASGIWCVDVDGADGEAALRDLEAKHGELPPTVEQITGSGGRQLFFRHNEPLRNSSRRLGDGLDTRADGGYVVLPPSVHPTGGVYTWSVDCAETFADAPEWLLSLLRKSTGGQATPASDWRALVQQGATEGERNTAVARLAGHLLRRFVDPYVTLELVQAWNAAANQPPLDPAEVQQTVDSIARREMQRREARGR